METINASEVKREFGDALLKVQRGPLTINKNGKPVAVMVSAKAYAELQRFREQQLRHEIDAGMADIEAGRVVSEKEVMQRMRSRIGDDTN